MAGHRGYGFGLVAPTIRALAETIISAEIGRDDLDGVEFIDETADVLWRKLNQMQRHLRAGMVVATVGFDLLGVLQSGRPFRQRSLPERRAQLDLMRNAPVGLLTNFVTFYEKMGIFGYHSTVEEAAGGHA